MPIPSNLNELRSFLGMVTYYRRFIKDCSAITAPLVELTEKGRKFVMTPERIQAIEELKRRLASAPILAHPDYKREFIVHTDASVAGLGAVLSQVQDGEERVIRYASRRLNKAERNYGISELECLGAVYAVETFRPYLWGKRFKLITDHTALQWLFKTAKAGKLLRWTIPGRI